ncbi:MAG: DUF2452 domain-containing protein [Gammaproteobacteria bacterium]|nr:DUF2452 domain-containing protein [Gammaproteobacteria bacterium]
MNDTTDKSRRGAYHQGESRSAPYPVSRLAPPIELVDLARQVAEADNMVNAQATARLRSIAKQIKALQQEARDVLEDTRRNQELHRARCNFRRIAGKVYHLYRTPADELYFSMLSPEDWGNRLADHYEGAYRLENDMSWTPEAAFEDIDDSRDVIEHLLENLGPDRGRRT